MGFQRGLIVRGEHIKEDEQFNMTAWRQMRWIRNFEICLMEHYQAPYLTRCPIHYCIGQEGLPAYISLLKQEGDYLFTNHRNHGYYLSWDDAPTLLLAELMGKEQTPTRGRAGSQEVSNYHLNFHSGAILSTMIGIATGTAFGIELDKDLKATRCLDNWDLSPGAINEMPDFDETRVVICAFGDGAADEGIFWEAMNLIALRGLPILLLCENNGYATFSAQGRRQARPIAERVRSFGIQQVLVNATDTPGALGLELRERLDYVRKYRRPVFIEHMTYRHCGHVGVDLDTEQAYRTDEERERWKKNDDLSILENELYQAGLITEEQIAEIDEVDRKRFEKAWKNASRQDDAEPIDYTEATISSTVKREIPYEEDYKPEQFREAVLRPY
jgi:TPP-dependent pyruvate/acetoin dehydrogenase alpha subunit